LAHQFKNHLSSIVEFCERSLNELPETDITRADLLEIRKAADAAITLLPELSIHPDDLQRLASVYDLTERRHLEENLLQAQKMEAVGRLTSGIAHDFNSLVTVISGYGGLALEQVPQKGQLRDDLLEIRNTTERAASLVRQLLAFSRRRPLQPSLLDLNGEVVRVEKMLRRLISEDIDVRVQLEPGPCWVKADPGQIEQVLVNLAVNAQDAMPHGGTLTMQTADVDLTEAYARTLRPVGAWPGAYVMLRVSDTGTGLTSDAQAHLFEPFFTTKEPGKGTGLGLATVYAIVKQNGGCISVDSELAHGTAFTIHLPRVREACDPAEPVAAQAAPQLGSETILLVEDEGRLRELVGRVLQLSGYTVLEARNPGEAVLTADGYSGAIHLLLTDVVMPGTDGCALAELVTQSRRDLKVLYMSGHTDHAALLQGALDDSIAFLAKPFTSSVLLRKVRQVLDRAD
jgi:signal transduction histidine kinase/ActR/RegA family two-component response regulator